MFYSISVSWLFYKCNSWEYEISQDGHCAEVSIPQISSEVEYNINT
jgi:hypothetical protein